MVVGVTQRSLAQVTIFPDVERRTDESVQIVKIEVTDIFTIVDMLYISEAEDAWICIDKNFYIQPSNSSERKYLIMAKEIPLCPDRKRINGGGDEFEFQLTFPGIDTSVMKIDVVEKPVSGFNFFGVWLDKSNTRPAPDSLLITSREEFQSYFDSKQDHLKPLEGIWDLTIKRGTYQGEVFLEYLEEEPKIFDVALIWRNGYYECYDMDGKPLEMQFHVIAEGGRYAFKEYFQEIKEEVTTFIFMEDLDLLEFRFKIPRRWAKYLQSGKSYNNQDLLKIMSWERAEPEISEE